MTPELHASFLAEWGFIMRDSAIPCKEIKKIKDLTKKGEKSPNWDSVVVLENIALLDHRNLS